MQFSASLSLFRQELQNKLLPYYGISETAVIVQWLLEEQGSLTDWPDLHRQAQRLLSGEPIQYVIGKGHFYGRDFQVEKGVLIPRRETEELMIWIRDSVHSADTCIKGLDIGTGTGCIPISLELEWEERGRTAELIGIDLEEACVRIATENAKTMEAKACTFQQMDILQVSKDAFSGLDFIVSNPPYIPMRERASLRPHVREYEPEKALFVPDQDPLLFYRSIAEKALKWLKPEGYLFFEIHQDFGDESFSLLQNIGFGKIVLRKDLQGRDRMLCGQKI